MQCGKWVLRDTKVRRSRGIELKGRIVMRKRAASPALSAQSVVGENTVKEAMERERKIDTDNWSSHNTKSFIQIMVDQARKEQGTCSRKRRAFNQSQWNEIHNRLVEKTQIGGYTHANIQQKFDRLKKEYKIFKGLVEHTGLGWDPNRETATAPPHVWEEYVKANPGTAKYGYKGLENYDLLQELFESSVATGAFAHPSSQLPPTSDEEMGMNSKGKAVNCVDSGTTGSGKRKSSDGGRGSCKREKSGAYHQIAFANQMKGEYYANKINMQRETKRYSVANVMPLLAEIKPFVEELKYAKAFEKLGSDEGIRQAFMEAELGMRVAYVTSLK